jgi:hypothetical protein
LDRDAAFLVAAMPAMVPVIMLPMEDEQLMA